MTPNITAKKFVIITGYFKEESYGLLGPQMAATIISENSEYEAIVLGVTNEDDKTDLLTALDNHFGESRMIIGFSTLGGRPDLFDLAKELKEKGAVTILAGPQANVDFKGEKDHDRFEHRFKGMSDRFTFALHGPAQQILPILENGFKSDISEFDGVLYQNDEGQIKENPAAQWEDQWLSRVDWTTLYRLKDKTFVPMPITCGQVLQQIGCPHAAKQRKIQIDYPIDLVKEAGPKSVTITQKGCSFCDVAIDKGFMGAVGEAAVKSQMECLPKQTDGSRVAFELINESPLPKLERVMELADESGIELSQINLTMRADYFLKGLGTLEKTLESARQKNIRILLASIGFESFDDTILKNLNKGVTRQMNLDTIKAIRDLKPKFPYHFGYLKEEGANHGFIHPTPWDTPKISSDINRTIAMYRLDVDILPNHSTPLIIHHASGLADWVRQIEKEKNIRFERVGTTIGWWQHTGVV
jgi:hypothetical protein